MTPREKHDMNYIIGVTLLLASVMLIMYLLSGKPNVG
jgi:hypothetical protein